MDYLNYWTGKDTDYKKIWDTYNKYTDQYLIKIKSTRNLHLIIEFDEPSSELPLLNAEAVFKTLQGLYHDLKQECLSQDEYESATPLALYSIQRGSSLWDFLISAEYFIPFIYLFAKDLVKFQGNLLDNKLKELQIEKIKKELEKMNQNRIARSKSKISSNMLDHFIENHKLPIENLLAQKPKRIIIKKTEETIHDTYFQNTEVITIEFTNDSEQSDGPSLVP